MNEKPSVGVAVILTRDDKVLLMKRKGPHGPGTWTTPGGHMEFGETPEQCATREVKEEVGVEITAIRFRAVTNDLFQAERRHSVSIWMEGKIRAGEPTVIATEEASEIGWFAWEALPQPLYLPLENFITQNSYPPK
ncbi:MAG TPA: NUDIX domain-containing protein [Anaerolineales bacterium]|nr:NUDIX domain-containing protein [Anaerolineales bacterium]